MVREALTWDAVRALEPRDAAACFIARRAEGLSNSEQQLLTRWLALDEMHQRVFASADRAWQSFAGAEDHEILTAMRAHALAPRHRVFGFSRTVAAAAAVVLLAVGAALFLVPEWNLLPSHSSANGSTPAAAVEYASARGEVKELALPDGSSMTLDADSAAVGRFTEQGRAIELQRGRAYFAVKSDRSRPFAVTVGGRFIVAVGTRFDINLMAEGVTVTLLEGRVEVRSGGTVPVTLEPGQEYRERLGKATIRGLGEASDRAVAWRAGFINFDDQPLTEAAAVMNRYSSDQIVVGDPALASLRVTGQFRAGETQRFAATVSELYRLRSTSRANQIELLPGK